MVSFNNEKNKKNDNLLRQKINTNKRKPSVRTNTLNTGLRSVLRLITDHIEGGLLFYLHCSWASPKSVKQYKVSTPLLLHEQRLI